MAQIKAYIAMSHSPFWDKSFDVSGAGSKFVDEVAKVKAQVDELSPDLVVIFGPDHMRNFFYDLMPAFCIGAGEIDSFGDYGSHQGSIPGTEALGHYLVESVRSRGFDPAFSLRMGIDHGIVQPYEVLFPKMDIPVIPIMVDCAAAPRPTLKRSYEFGQAVGESLRLLDDNLDIVIIASGGLSHWVGIASPYDESTDQELREFLIDGRETVREYNAAREAGLAQRISEGHEGRVNPEWDEWFLECIKQGNIQDILNQDPEHIEETAGNGAHEVRAWVAGLGAWGHPVQNFAYEPVPKWSTGMGVISSFYDSTERQIDA